MGAVGGLLGLNGGFNGTGAAAPELAKLLQPTTAGQATDSYNQNQVALQQQQRLLAAIQGQNGLGNQSQVYGQLQGVVNGTGPNPAQAQLAQATGQNAAQTASLMAGARGASNNVGLIARQAGQQGAATQQQAVGQAATLQAQQSLDALNSAGALANTQAANQIGATSTVTGAQQAQQQTLLNAIAGQNQANVANQGNVNSANAGLASTTMTGQQGLVGGALNAAGGLFKANGGTVGYAGGGAVSGPQSSLGKFLTGFQMPNQFGNTPQGAAAQSLQTGVTNFANGIGHALRNLYSSTPAPATWAGSDSDEMAGGMAADGGMVPVVVSPGEKIASPAAIKQAVGGGKLQTSTVPGKAKVKGDSVENDTVPAEYPAGTIVVPRSKASKPESFVQATLAKRKGKR